LRSRACPTLFYPSQAANCLSRQLQAVFPLFQYSTIAVAAQTYFPTSASGALPIYFETINYELDMDHKKDISKPIVFLNQPF
jgi:hypothetical protein